MKWISPARVKRALYALHDWWTKVHSQGGKHLLPLLALLEAGAGKGEPVHFEERPHEYDFWNRYFRVPGNDEMPYIFPLTLKRVEADYPHSNAATIRKQTFMRAWEAGELTTESDGESYWSLSKDFAEIFRGKALTKGGRTQRVPLVDLAALMLRREVFPDEATARTLEERFRDRFPMRSPDYDGIFEFVDEDPAELFVTTQPSDEAYDDAMVSAIAAPVAAPAPKTEAIRSPPLESDDQLLLRINELLQLGSTGIILRGVAGTGKTWYAQQIAASLVKDPTNDIFRVQFHPSYGYEDFVEGFVPSESTKSGFDVESKVFLDACNAAKATDGYIVLVVDEINRGDPSRIFGEVLTYIERDYRGRSFFLPYSGNQISIPPNLVLLGTMNQHDKSIAQLDAAFIRRFDHLDVLPSGEAVERFLEQSGEFSTAQISVVREWFESIQELVPTGVGHTYLKDAKKPEDLQLIWRYRMWPTCEAALEFEPHNAQHVKAAFDAMYARVLGQEPPA